MVGLVKFSSVSFIFKEYAKTQSAKSLISFYHVNLMQNRINYGKINVFILPFLFV